MTAYTNSLRLTLPVTGTDDGTWGETVNTGITSLVDASIAGTATVAHDNTANYTLTDNDGAADEARQMFLNITGTLTAARNVVCPGVSKLYFITNNTTGGYAVTLKTSGGTGISVANGKSAALYCNGTNVVYAFDQVTLQPTVSIAGNMDSGTTDYAVTVTPAIQSNVTTSANIFSTAPTTEADTFTLTSLRHYFAQQGTFGAGSTVSNQYGFITSGGMTGATFNYGFHANAAATASVAITSITGTGSTATVESASSHGLTTGDSVFISGTSTAGFNGGPYTVNVTDSNTFTYSSTETVTSTGGYSTQTNDWNFYANGSAPNWFGGPTIIAANSYMDALRITQTGSGNAFIVEDSTNPDTTPFVITAAGDVGIGTSSPASKLNVKLSGASDGLIVESSSNDAFVKLRHNGTASYVESSYISTAGYTPLLFNTSGATKLTLDTSGNLGLGVTPSAWKSGYVASQVGAGGYVMGRTGSTVSEVTLGTNSYFDTTDSRWEYIGTGLAAQYGLIDGQHRFYTAPTGLANGAITWTQAMTLDASGNLGIKTTTIPSKLSVVPTSTSTAAGAWADSAIAVNNSTVLNEVSQIGFGTFAGSATKSAAYIGFQNKSATSFGYGDLIFGTRSVTTDTAPTERMRIDSSGRVIVGTTTVGDTNAMLTVYNPNDTSAQIYLQNTTTGVGNNGSRILATGNDLYITNKESGVMVFETNDTERMRIRGDGRVSIGGSGSAAVELYLQRDITGAVTAYGTYTSSTVQSDVTNGVFVNRTNIATAAAAFTLTSLIHYHASQGTIGAGSSVTSQYGFFANNTLVDATNNYGFYSDLPAAANAWNFYAASTAASYFAGDVRTDNGFLHTTAVNNSNTSLTLTTSSTLAGGIRTGTPAANINYTLPTGTSCDSYFTSLQTSMGAEWNIVNLAAATYSITVLANTGHTVVGNMVVAANTSARFLTRKTGTNTFVTYRIA